MIPKAEEMPLSWREIAVYSPEKGPATSEVVEFYGKHMEQRHVSCRPKRAPYKSSWGSPHIANFFATNQHVIRQLTACGPNPIKLPKQLQQSSPRVARVKVLPWLMPVFLPVFDSEETLASGRRAAAGLHVFVADVSCNVCTPYNA